MPEYTIYKIQVGDQIYIGSTKDFKNRKYQHKCQTKKENPLIIYQAIREAGGWQKNMMVPIELYECETPTEACIREQYWLREYKATLNTRQAYTTAEEKRTSWNNYQREYAKKRYHRLKAEKKEALKEWYNAQENDFEAFNKLNEKGEIVEISSALKALGDNLAKKYGLPKTWLKSATKL